jgi:hypothetical protein
MAHRIMTKALWDKKRQMFFSIYLLVEFHSLIGRTITRIMLFGHTSWDWHSITPFSKEVKSNLFTNTY